LIHELISGPFDADKLDYLSRDAYLCGVPVVTDISRLIQKVRVADLPLDRLPLSVKKSVEAGHGSYLMTGIALSGGRTMDELMLSKALLADKIYRHHKVRAAEAMVSSALHALSEIVPGSVAMLPYKLVDDELIDLTKARVESLMAGGNIPAGSESWI